MAAFNYAVKVRDEEGFSEDYFTVIAWGTKKRMMEWAEHFDKDPRTVASKITREKDGKVVHSYKE